MKGAYANIAAATSTRGVNSFLDIYSTAPADLKVRPTARCDLPPVPHRGVSTQHSYSVITGSNVHSASVTNTTSKNTSIASHARAIGSSAGCCSSAAVPRTPAMMTGTVIGYNSTGSIT